MILDLGLIDYEECYRIQKEFVKRRSLKEIEDSFLIAEHPPIFTIGRSGSRKSLLVGEEALDKDGIKVLDVDRGGDITFHGPGQIVIYPIIDLKKRTKDLHYYMRSLEEMVIDFLSGYSIQGRRIPGKTGVWTDSGKIGFIGIAAANWITYHGVSINVNVDLGYFSMMHPCGMSDIEVTSMRSILNRYIPMDEAKGKISEYVNNIFNTYAAVA